MKIPIWYNLIVNKPRKKAVRKRNNLKGADAMKRNSRRFYVSVGLLVLTPALLVVLLCTLTSCAGAIRTFVAPSVTPSQDKTSVINEIAKPLDTPTAPIPTNTATIEPTATLQPTSTETPTVVPTEIPVYDPVKGPIILLVSPDDSVELLNTVLTESVEKGYKFSDFTNFETYERPLIVAFDNVSYGGVTANQASLFGVLDAFNATGVFAVNSAGNKTAGTPYLANLVTEGWEFAFQAEGYIDLQNYSGSDLLALTAGKGQIKCQGEVYASTGYFPQVWIPPYGTIGENFIPFILDLNEMLSTEQRLAGLNSTGIHFIVSDDYRSSISSEYGPVEIYPSFKLSEFDFEKLSY